MDALAVLLEENYTGLPSISIQFGELSVSDQRQGAFSLISKHPSILAAMTDGSHQHRIRLVRPVATKLRTIQFLMPMLLVCMIASCFHTLRLVKPSWSASRCP